MNITYGMNSEELWSIFKALKENLQQISLAEYQYHTINSCIHHIINFFFVQIQDRKVVQIINVMIYENGPL
jgi:hypothetical protein